MDLPASHTAATNGGRRTAAAAAAREEATTEQHVGAKQTIAVNAGSDKHRTPICHTLQAGFYEINTLRIHLTLSFLN